jgi:hypothetical protein
MSNLQHDPNFPRHAMREYDAPVQWGAVAVILLLCGALIAASFWPAGETQTAMNSPSMERVTPIPTAPPQAQ